MQDYAEFLSLLLDACEDKNFDRESNLCVQQCIFKIIENLPDATFIINREGRVVFWNQAIEELTGVKKSQILGRGNYAYAVPFYGIPRPMLVDCFFSGNEVLKKWYKSITRRGDKLYTRVFCPLLNNGRGAFIWAVAFPLKDSKGQVIGAVESIRDITEQLQLKKMLQESTLKFKTLFNSTNDAVFLYELKDGSKANYFFEVNQKTYEYIDLDSRLNEALKHNELLLYYQPIFDLNNYKIVGAEALLRWKHPTLGMVSPDKFIPIAEKRGLITAIGRWVLHNACLQGVTWKQEGLPELRISVNISVHQFEQNNLVEVVSEVLKETKFNPSLLQLEITESVSMKNPRDNMNMLADLRKMGVHIALDDFGTGYSSLSYLTWLSLDALKIDRSLINALPTSKNNVAIVEAIIEMAHQLGIKVTAEGVETKEQVRILKDKGCDYVQGYFFSKPLPSQEFKKFVLKSQ